MYKTLKSGFIIVFSLITFSCTEDNVKPNLRAKISYSLATAETPYSTLFVDGDEETTVDLADGNTLHKIFQALNYYSTSSVTANAHIDASKLNLLFVNSGDPFTDISTASISVIGANLNASPLQLKNTVASSQSAIEAEVVRTKFESFFDEIDEASNSVSGPASAGVAGKVGSYLFATTLTSSESFI